MSGDLIGKSIPMIDGLAKVSGKLTFTSDLELPGLLYGKVLRSPLAHAKILNIDTSQAKKLTGVRVVLTGRDRLYPYYSVAGQSVLDEQLLAGEKVHYVGDEVAVIAAIDPDIAAEALRLIKVDYEELPVLLDPLEAMREGAPLIHPDQQSNVPYKIEFSRGNLLQGFKESAVIVEDSFSTPLQYHGYLEPHAAVAQWDARGRVTLWIPMQSPTLGRITYSKALGISEDQVRIIQMPIGGAFGGKLEYKLHVLCALLAREANRPVKMINTREEDFLSGLPRVPMQIRMKLGVRADGILAAKETEIVADSGAYVNYAHGILLSACHRHDNLYRINNLHTKGFLVYTNKLATGCFRGFGNPQVHFAYESLLDMAAEKLSMDPAELRLKNAIQAGDTTPHGWKVLSSGLSDCIRQSTNGADWNTKRQQKQENKRFARGIGLACCLHVSGNRTFLPYFDGACSDIRINEQGKVIVFVGETDLGQGALTTFAQIAAHELGVDISDVTVSYVDTDTSPHGLGTFGDRATTLGGNAVRLAAIDARVKLLTVAAAVLKTEKDELDISKGIISSVTNLEKKMTVAEAAKFGWAQLGGGLITGQGVYIPPDVSMVDPQTKYGNISCAYPFAAQVAEVEVDRLTGTVKVLNMVAAHDLGKTLNPLLAEGQVQGAIAQGIGYTLMEDMGMKKGIVFNRNFEKYNMPRITDVSPITTIFVESNDPNGPYGGKGLAEPALTPTAPSIANAIFNAVGVRIKELPITPEKILRAMEDSNI
ncbi:xanthine dehydrogenase family protein molybdopterin-binding subunit [Desulfosporosinus metallidurans]|uniref:Xanthine dehydrogenase, molybdenum binding subunit n=1 Tax=Desulfosporosinus metallidurans TaxID=1888891 RepID=A0A1Q8QZ97_9FIRM|nr:xanthine dehydrogenase family protein molybdopterin-binding subunit [Desulfosporosinus metallidurans]OLN32635.1 Xanthine dehydrogenase, molybdenum binding subunit [Desulfosporosinus metallidurans]